MSQADTIYALASAPGKGGVAVVRVSGDWLGRAHANIAGNVPPARKAVLRKLVHPQTGEAIDRALVLFFSGPQSFTGEDVAEFQIHGGRAVVAALYSALEFLWRKAGATGRVLTPRGAAWPPRPDLS